RGFAVLLVFLVHYHTIFGPFADSASVPYVVSSALEAIGHCGVDLFFVLSGYIIYGSLINRRLSYSGFLTRRVQRLYPAFICVCAIYLLLSLAIPAVSKIPNALGEAAIFLLENLLFLPGIFDLPVLVTVSWSLSYELFFYLTLPLLVLLLKLRCWPS